MGRDREDLRGLGSRLSARVHKSISIKYTSTACSPELSTSFARIWRDRHGV